MKPISLIQFLIEERRAGHINAELSLLIEVVARACKRIAVATKPAWLWSPFGLLRQTSTAYDGSPVISIR